MPDKTEAVKQSEQRVNKAAWMNDQLGDRLPDADYVQPGVAPAKDARADNDYPVQGGKVASPRRKAADES